MSGKVGMYDRRITFLLMAILVELMVLPKLPTRSLIGYPVYMSYLLIFSVGLFACFTRREIRYITTPILVMIGSIIFGTLIAALFFGLDLWSSFVGRTSSCGLIWYVLLPGSIGLGYLLSKGQIRYEIVFACLLIAVALVLLLTYYPALSNVLIRVYSISERVTGAYLMWRSPGMYNGAEKSACAINMILLILVIGSIQKQVPRWFVFVGSAAAAVHHMVIATRGGIGLLGLILLAYFRQTYTLPRKLFYALIAALVVGIILWSGIASLNIGSIQPYMDKLSSRFSQVSYMTSRIRESLLDTKSSDFILTRPLSHLKIFYARWVKSPILGSGLSEDKNKPPFDYRGYHNIWLIVLAGGGVTGFLALVWSVRRISRLQFILVLPFFIPGLTNGFPDLAPAQCIYGILVGHLLGTQWRQWRMLRESQEIPEADEEKELAAVQSNSSRVE